MKKYSRDTEGKVMNIHRIVARYVLMLLLMLSGFNAYAEKWPFVSVAISSNKVMLAKDGTGIVKGIKCKGCDFNFVKITPASKATNQGVEVSIMEVRELNSKVVMVSFTPATREVQYIRW